MNSGERDLNLRLKRMKYNTVQPITQKSLKYLSLDVFFWTGKKHLYCKKIQTMGSPSFIWIHEIIFIHYYYYYYYYCYYYYYYYRGADKYLARPDWKNNWKVSIFHPTWRSLLPRRTGWTDNFLNCLWVACKSQSLVTVACFLPGRAKDLLVPRYYCPQNIQKFPTHCNKHLRPQRKLWSTEHTRYLSHQCLKVKHWKWMILN